MTKEQVLDALSAKCRKSIEQRGVMTTNEAAELLGVSDATIKRMADCGKIKVKKTAGGHRMFPLDSLRELRTRRPVDEQA
jgi:excisionase family DNA binding protein